MKFLFIVFGTIGFFSFSVTAQPKSSDAAPAGVQTNLYIDVHHMGAGKVKAEDVAAAHEKDLQTESKYGVHFIKYWVDETAGNVYCLSSSPDAESIRKTHAEAHGLLPDQIYTVKEGAEASAIDGENFYLDIHELGAGKVKVEDVAAAHQKDLETQQKYGVNFINYFVNEKTGEVMCLSQAHDSSDVIKTHKEAHGLIPASITEVKTGK
jgi:hypothetical protein